MTYDSTNVLNPAVIRVLDVGTNSKVSLKVLFDEVYLLEVHDNGFCWHSEESNKRATPRFCDQTPKPTAGIIGYNYATFFDFVDRPSGFVTGCDSAIVNGVISQGENPSFVITNNAIAFGVHHGLTEYPDPTMCGVPTIFDSTNGGMIVAAWDLVYDIVNQ